MGRVGSACGALVLCSAAFGPALCAQTPVGCDWETVPGAPNGMVRALLEHDDGAGRALFVGGLFTIAGGASASNVARFDGSAWHALGLGMDGPVLGFAVTDLGLGPGLVAFGEFASADGAPANRIALWNGAAWSALAPGLLLRPTAAVHYESPSGPRLVVGGATPAFTGPFLQTYDGAQWASVPFTPLSAPTSLAVENFGLGSELVISDQFALYRWSGGAVSTHVWHSLGVPGVLARVPTFDNLLLGADGWIPPTMQPGPTPQGRALSRVTAGGIEPMLVNVAVETPGTNHAIRRLTDWDGPQGPTLVAAGDFTHAAGTWVETSRVARIAHTNFDGVEIELFLPVGSGIDVEPRALSSAVLLGVDHLFVGGQNLASAGRPIGSMGWIAPCSQPVPAWSDVHGCGEDPAALFSWYDLPQVGKPFEIALSVPVSDFMLQAWLLPAVALELGPAGCGVPLAGIGPLLVKGFVLPPSGPLPPTLGGFFGFAPLDFIQRWKLQVPPIPALAGSSVAFQALVLRPAQGSFGLTRAVVASIGM